MTLPFITLPGSTQQTPGGTYWWASSFIEATGIPSEEAFGTPGLGSRVSVTGIPSEEAFGATTLTYNQTLAPDSIAEEGFGTPVVAHAEDQIARANGIPSAEAFGNPTLLEGFVLKPTGIPSAEAFGLMSIPSPPQFDAVGAGFANSTGFGNSLSYSHHGSVSAYALVDISTDQPVNDPTVTYDGIEMTQLASADLGSISSLGAGHYFRYGLANIPGGSKTIEITFGTHDLGIEVSSGSVSYLGVASVGLAVVTTLTTGGSLSQSTTLASSQLAVQAFAGDNAKGKRFTAVSGGNTRFVSSDFTAQLSISDTAAASTTFTASTDSSGTYPEYWLGCVTTLLASVPVLDVTGIPSEEAFGTPTFMVASPQTVAPTGIPSAGAFGVPTLGALIAPAGIPSAEAFGNANVISHISPTGIASAEAFGTLVVGANIQATGIPSAEAFGTASVGLIVQPSGIASAEAFGDPTVANESTLSVDYVGTGVTGSADDNTWTHITTAGATVFVFTRDGAAFAPKYDGTNMTLVAKQEENDEFGFDYLQLWKIVDATGGTKTIDFPSSFSNPVTAVSISINNVASIGAAAKVFGNSGTMSQSVSPSTGQLALQGFCNSGSSASSPSGGTNQFNNFGMTISTATASATFTASNPGTKLWAGIAVILS